MVNQERIVKLFCELVEIDSASLEERALADFVISNLKSMHVHIYEDQAGKKIGGNCGNIYVAVPGDLDLPPVLFSVHLDTVQPGYGKKAVIDEAGIIRSNGNTVLGADDLAGIAAILEALTQLRERHVSHRPIEILFSVAEEAHLRGINQLDPSKIRSQDAYILDTSGPPGLAILKAPGHIKLEISIQGKAAHAGIEPDKGVSAISIAAQAITDMQLGQVDDETTANIGYIQGGGETNIVAEHCFLTAESRSLSMDRLMEQINHMKRCLEHHTHQKGAKVKIKEHVSYWPYSVEPNSSVVKRFEAACESVHLQPRYASTGGGSDNNVLQQHGINGMVISCGMQNVHSVKEFIATKDLVKTSELVIALILSAI